MEPIHCGCRESCYRRRSHNHTTEVNLNFFLDSTLYVLSLFITSQRFCREKEAETREFLEEAKSCVDICRSNGVFLLINDRIDIALACDADGVHVGQSDMPVDLVRSLLGPDKIIGVSCKTQEQAHQAWKDGADYIGSGGVFPTNTKTNNRTIGLDGLREVCKASKLPVVAIGGIGISNAESVMRIGEPNLKGVAVVSALFDQECVLSEAKKLHKSLTESKREH